MVMAFHRCLHRRLNIPTSLLPVFLPHVPLLRPNNFATSARIHAVYSTKQLPSELFEYTSGRWIYNDALRRSKRRREFNIPELKRLAAEAVNRNAEDVIDFKKLAEGGFNRTFIITMRDGFQLVARIPYPITEPKYLLVASEVATMDFLRLNGIPVPQPYGYSPTSDNPAETEYIFMELVDGMNLGDVWFSMPEKARIAVVSKLVEMESRLFTLRFPASGSLYYTKDLPDCPKKVKIPAAPSANGHEFCIGPDTTYGLWYGKRQSLRIDRGPYMDSTAALAAGAKKEIAYLKSFGRPLQPYQRLRREIHKYQKLSHLDHLDSLDKYLQIASYLTPNDDDSLTLPTMRHPDLQPNNVLVSSKSEITGLIDWQHCSILPLFLQCGIPNSFQNYNDAVSEALQLPELPSDFDKLNETQQFEQLEVLRRRQLHYYYVILTEKLNPLHYHALELEFSILRRKVFRHASDPWEGDNATLQADLIRVTENWSKITGSELNTKSSVIPPCPISFPEDVVSECLRLNSAQIEADEELEACREVIGVGPEGWVPTDHYEEAKQRESKLKADSLAAAESEEERATAVEHWIFDDFDEEEYSW